MTERVSQGEKGAVLFPYSFNRKPEEAADMLAESDMG